MLKLSFSTATARTVPRGITSVSSSVLLVRPRTSKSILNTQASLCSPHPLRSQQQQPPPSPYLTSTKLLVWREGCPWWLMVSPSEMPPSSQERLEQLVLLLPLHSASCREAMDKANRQYFAPKQPTGPPF